MSKKKNSSDSDLAPAEAKPERKTPVRNPVRKLYMEKARLEFEQSGLVKKSAEEIERHAKAIAAICRRKDEIVARFDEIEAELSTSQNQELFPSQD